MALKARARVVEKHTFDHRVQSILEQLEKACCMAQTCSSPSSPTRYEIWESIHFIPASPLPPEALPVPKFKKWGFGHRRNSGGTKPHQPLKTVKAALDRNGLVCGSVCACMSPDRDLRGTAKQKEGLAYLACKFDRVGLDCPSLIEAGVFCSGPCGHRSAKEYVTVENCGQHLRASALMLKNGNGVICLEPLNRFETDFIAHRQIWLKMIRIFWQAGTQIAPRYALHEHQEKNRAKQSSKPASIWVIFTPAAVSREVTSEMITLTGSRSLRRSSASATREMW